MERIIVEIPRGAKGITVRVECVEGASCVDVSRGIEAALGKVVRDEQTADYYMEPLLIHHTER